FDVVQAESTHQPCAEQRLDVSLNPASIQLEGRCLDRPTVRPSRRPASACSRYQSHTSFTVKPALTVRRSADGSPPSATAVSFLRARSRAISGVSTPY